MTPDRTHSRSLAIVVLALLLLAGWTAGAQAQDSATAEVELEVEGADELRWNYPRVRTWQYVVTFSSPLALELMDATLDEAEEARWEGGILVDEPVYDLLVGRTRTARDLADKVTDGSMLFMWVTPLVLDGIIIALLIEQKPDVAWQMLAVALQAYATNALLTLTLLRVVARERPLVDDCRDDPEFSDLCGSQSFKSFPSGHTSTAFMGAGLLCVQHLHLELLGSPGDEIVCGTSLALATATGIVRMTAARHYLSDVIVGAGIGLGFGWLVPWLLHYGQPLDEPREGVLSNAFVSPTFDGDAVGVSAGTAF